MLKGDDTLVATPNGNVAVSRGFAPALATAGTGDVLSGIIGALLAQGVDALDAAAAGAWLHGRAAQGGPPRGLVASDVIDGLPAALTALEDGPAGGRRHDQAHGRDDRIDPRHDDHGDRNHHGGAV